MKALIETLKEFLLAFIVCVTLLLVGGSIILEGKRTDELLPQYETFNKFQEVTYRQVLHIQLLYSVKQGDVYTSLSNDKIIECIGELNTQKDSLYSEILTFPSTLEDIKCYSDSLYDKSNVAFSAYESGYKDVVKDEEPWNAYIDVLKTSVKSIYYCSIDMSEVAERMGKWPLP